MSIGDSYVPISIMLQWEAMSGEREDMYIHIKRQCEISHRVIKHTR